MKNNLLPAALLLIIISCSSCEAIAGIFKAGVWSGVIIVGVIIAVIVFIISKANKKN